MSTTQAELKPRLAIVSSYNICCGIAFYAEALRSFLSPAFDVEIIDLKTSELLRQEGENFKKMSEQHIDFICKKLQEFDVVNVHMELGIYGTNCDAILSRIFKICSSSHRLIVTVHSIDYKENNSQFSHIHKTVMHLIKQRHSSHPYHLIAHLPRENALLRKHFGFTNVTDFPIIFLTNEKREHFQSLRNPNIWKKQFGFNEQDIVLGMFGLISKHKNYTHALKTLSLLPENYKLLVVGEAHHMNIQEWKVDDTITEITTYLDKHPSLANRVYFTGKRNEEKYYSDLANVDFVLLPSYEVGQAATGGLSTALELSCAILKSNTLNSIEHQDYFPDCFEVFDIGNHYETKNKILNFDKSKLENLKRRMDFYTEVQVREMYLRIYEEMKLSTKEQITSVHFDEQLRKLFLTKKTKNRSLPLRTLIRILPAPAKKFLKKLRDTVKNN